jgi:Na+-transporting NADH:ubiquinone oxidoreductase subunit D
MTSRRTRALLDPVVEANPITLQILGVCSALAVTKTLATALVMSAAVIAVLTLSNASVSVLRHHMPRHVRLIVEITIVASLVITTDQIIKAFAYELSKQLSVFVGLIVTNCIIIGRAEAFAMKNPVHLSVLDGLGNGLGYAAVLVIVGATRELFGVGTLLGLEILPSAAEGGWYQPVTLMLLPPSAFFIIGFLIWGLRMWKPTQIEQPDYRIRPSTITESVR